MFKIILLISLTGHAVAAMEQEGEKDAIHLTPINLSRVLDSEKEKTKKQLKATQETELNQRRPSFIENEFFKIDTCLRDSHVTDVERIQLQLRRNSLMKRSCYVYQHDGVGEITDRNQLKMLELEFKQLTDALRIAQAKEMNNKGQSVFRW